MTFLTMSFVDVEELSVRLAPPDGGWKETEEQLPFEFQAPLHRPLEAPDPPTPHQMLATWAAVQDLRRFGSEGGVIGG